MFGDVLLKDNVLYHKYKAWFSKAQVNDKYVYWTGNALSESIVGMTIGQVLREEYDRGKVYLFQRKKAPFMYDHIAIKKGD